MSLRDTIEGARREAEGNVVGRPKKEAEAVTGGEDEKHGFARSSAAKARPAREAASSVRTAGKSSAASAGGGLFGGSGETKEQKKERKRREREESDLRNRVYDAVLRGIDGYRKTERTFWVFVGVGFGLAVISLAINWATGGTTDITTPAGAAGAGTLVLAYVFIIAGIVYDFAKRRPFRKQAQARVSGLSDKKLLDMYERERAAEEKRAAARAEKKAARK
ncbi:APC family permease [Thermophilibacter sp.]